MRLLSTVLATSTILTVDTVDGIPASDQLASRPAWLGFPGSAYEIIQVTAWVSSGSSYQLTVLRGQGGTTASPHSSGDVMHLVTEDIVNRGVTGPAGPTVQDEGVDLPVRSRLNFVGTSVTATDDAVNDRTNVGISGGSGGGPAFDVTDTPTNPPPYAGYATLSPTTYKAQIWTGSAWRSWDTNVVVTTPSDPTMLPSLVGRYRAKDLTYANGLSVSAWPDVSGLKNDLVVATPGVMQTSGINGHPSVLFDETTHYDLPTAVSRPVTVIAVMQNTDTAEGSVLFSANGGVAPYLGILNGTGVRQSDGSSVADFALADTMAPHIIYGQSNSNSTILSGADGGRTAFVGGNTAGFQRIGLYSAAPTYSMTGPVGEILVYNTVLSTTDLNTVIHQLGLDWGITTSV